MLRNAVAADEPFTPAAAQLALAGQRGEGAREHRLNILPAMSGSDA
jgi:hypothetical protein